MIIIAKYTELKCFAKLLTSDMNGAVEESVGNCPVCRKVFHTKDFEHVLDLVGTHSSELVCPLIFYFCRFYENIHDLTSKKEN